MALIYTTGQEMKKVDRVLFHREPGGIELVADPLVPDPETDGSYSNMVTGSWSWKDKQGEPLCQTLTLMKS